MDHDNNPMGHDELLRLGLKFPSISPYIFSNPNIIIMSSNYAHPEKGRLTLLNTAGLTGNDSMDVNVSVKICTFSCPLCFICNLSLEHLYTAFRPCYVYTIWF